MALSDDLKVEIKNIFNTSFKEREGTKVPEAENVTLGNDAVKLDATILYADMAKSTDLVEGYKWWFAAKLYKAFLQSACKLIRSEDGKIVSFDGDRVMAVYIGGSKNTQATRTALKIHYAQKMINELILENFNTNYQISHSVGIDKSEVRAVRTGIRGSNDLVWVGKAANRAAKLSEERFGSYYSWITEDVYSSMHDDVKYSSDGKNMWNKRHWSNFDKTVYCSSWWWTF